MKHKKTILAASLLAAALATTGVTLAFLTTSTEEVENVFSPTSVPIKVDETFDGKTKEDVRIQNTGTPENGTDAYIRAAVVKNWLNADDNSVVYLENDPYEFVDTKGAYFDLTDTDSQTGFSEWFYHGGYFYYYKPVAPQGFTGNLIDKWKVNYGTDENPRYILQVEILAQSVQSEPVKDGKVTAAYDLWGVTLTVANDGTITNIN